MSGKYHYYTRLSGYSGDPITSVSSRLWSLKHHKSGTHQTFPWSPFLLHPPHRFLHRSLQHPLIHWALFPSSGGFIPTSSRISVTYTHCLCSVPVTSVSHQRGFHALPALDQFLLHKIAKWCLKTEAWFYRLASSFHPSHMVDDQIDLLFLPHLFHSQHTGFSQFLKVSDVLPPLMVPCSSIARDTGNSCISVLGWANSQQSFTTQLKCHFLREGSYP